MPTADGRNFYGNPVAPACQVPPAVQVCVQGLRAMINDPMFIRDHLRHSASKWEQSQCFIISPHTLDRIIPDERWPTTFSNHFRFYQWRIQKRSAPRAN